MAWAHRAEQAAATVPAAGWACGRGGTSRTRASPMVRGALDVWARKPASGRAEEPAIAQAALMSYKETLHCWRAEEKL